jgi:elongation factor P
VKPGKGAAFVRTKLRNYVTGNTVERTFRAGEQIDEANISKEAMQYTYMDADQFVFMDMSSFEETRMSASELGDKTKWLKEGMECNVLMWNDKVIDVEVPITVIVKVTQTDPGFKGDTAQGGSKPATTETGVLVNVPLFVNQGDSIQVDTRTGQYMNRITA